MYIMLNYINCWYLPIFLTKNLITFQWKYVRILEFKNIYISIIQHYNLRAVTLQSDHSTKGHICHHTATILLTPWMPCSPPPGPFPSVNYWSALCDYVFVFVLFSFIFHRWMNSYIICLFISDISVSILPSVPSMSFQLARFHCFYLVD